MRARAAVGLLAASMLVFAASARARGSIGIAGPVLERQARTLAESSNPRAARGL